MDLFVAMVGQYSFFDGVVQFFFMEGKTTKEIHGKLLVKVRSLEEAVGISIDILFGIMKCA